MARLAAEAVRLFATLLVVALAAHGAAAITIPSILATSDGGAINFISLANTSKVVGVDVLAGDNSFSASLLGSWADSKYAFTVGTVTPGTQYRIFVTDLFSNVTKPALLGNLALPTAAYNEKTCPLPILGPMTGIKLGTGYQLQLTTHCTVKAAKACAKATGNTVADVISVYTYQYTTKSAAGAVVLGSIKADLKAVVPVPSCQRATLLGVQLNNNKLNVLARTYTTKANQGKNIGDLAVFELRSAFSRVKGVLVKRLSLTKTYRVVANGLNIVTAVPASAYSIFATVTDAKGISKVYNWGTGRARYIGGAAGTETTRIYDDLTTMAGNVYSALSDFTTVPAGDPPTGALVLTTAAQLKAGQPGTAIATDVVPYFEITYVGNA